jgi:hypothetical protein
VTDMTAGRPTTGDRIHEEYSTTQQSCANALAVPGEWRARDLNRTIVSLTFTTSRTPFGYGAAAA